MWQSIFKAGEIVYDQNINECKITRPRSLMDKVTVFGTVDVGSIPTEGTKNSPPLGGGKKMMIPQEVKNIIEKLNQAGFEAYAVGGCVRDLLFALSEVEGLARDPKDWDIATNALPEETRQIFPNSFYENKFGTVSVKVNGCHPGPAVAGEGSPANAAPPRRGDSSPRHSGAQNDQEGSQGCNIVEVTTYRIDEKYTDKRHPDSVCFTGNLQEDLARRDFTINAIALRLVPPTSLSRRRGELDRTRSEQAPEIIDPFGGKEDLRKGIIRAVGDPDKRFNEDALRMMRAVRLALELNSETIVKQSSAKQRFTPLESQEFKTTQADPTSKRKTDIFLTGFTIEPATKKAIQKNAGLLQAIAKERIRDELTKIIMTPLAAEGILSLCELNLLKHIIPELEKGIGVAQNRHHIYTIFEHGIFSLKFAAKKNYNLVVRLAALFHDIAKPQAKRGVGPDSTFYNHDIAGARIAMRILERLRFPRQTIEAVVNLIRHHMFVYDVGAVTEAGVRRLLRRVGPENIKDLIALRVADRLGSGVPKAQPYRLRHFQYMAEKVQHDAISVKMLKINGHEIMEILKIKPGPKIGMILDVLLAEVIEEPRKNDESFLAERIKELNKVDLAQLRQMAKERIDEKKEEDDKIIKDKYWVK